MPACKIGSGVTKSGSPMPSEMTFFIVAAISKKRRMPEGGTDWTRWEINLFKSHLGRLAHIVRPETTADLGAAADERAGQQRILHHGFLVHDRVADDRVFHLAVGGDRRIR